MSFKVRDVRGVLEGITGSAAVAYCGRATPVVDLPRIAAMLLVFNSGRDCFWNPETMTFTTDPFFGANAFSEEGPNSGVVTSWDVEIKASGPASVFVTLGTRAEKTTSGSAVSSCRMIEIEVEQLPFALALLTSAYCAYKSGKLINSEIP